MSEAVTFRIIENPIDPLIGIYEDFKKDYMNTSLKVDIIKATYNLSDKQYKRLIDKVYLNTGFRRRNPQKHVPKKNINPPQYYGVLLDIKGNPTYQVQKSIKGNTIYFGCYHDKKVAELIIQKLKECNWNKSELPRIRKELGV